MLHDLHTHLIDQALQLFGPVTLVYAEVRAIDPAVTVSDDAFLALTHASGVTSHLTSSMSAGISGARYQVFGTRGAFVKYGVDVQEDALRAGARPGDAGYGVEPETMWGGLAAGGLVERIPTVRADYSPYYAAVANTLASDAPPPVTVPEVAAGLEVIEAAFESARTQAVVRL